MSLDEARLSGLAPPAGYEPPPPGTLADVARTGRAALAFLAPLLRAAISSRDAETLPATTTADGLAEIAERCRTALARLQVHLEVQHAEDVPRSGGLLLMWNQASHLDHLVLPAAIPRPFHSIYNNALRATPLYGEYLRTRGHFWVDRTDEAQWRAQLAAVAVRMRDHGACVLVSPEGTRSWDGRLLPMKRGAFALAREARCPIVCVTVIGGHDRLPRGFMAVRRGTVRVVFSAPLPVSADDPELERRVLETFEGALAR
jgi:1-acyl-sn-glycerol-3-phosphate acyltransferase